MSHEIETFAHAHNPAWHKLGVQVTADMTPEQMMEAAQLDWGVSLYPAYVDIGETRLNTGRSALVRSSDKRVLDVVTNDWKPMQNIDAFKFFDEFVKAGSMTMESSSRAATSSPPGGWRSARTACSTAA